MSSFTNLFSANLKIVYRNQSALFWTLVIPALIYSALSLLPLGKILGNGFDYKNYVLPGIIAYVIMQGGIYSLAYWMVDLRGRGVLKRLIITPIKVHQLVTSLLLSRILVMAVQILILTLLGIIIFKVHFAYNILSIAVLVLLGGGIFLLIGLLISNYAGSYETAAPITAAIGLPFTFLGDIFIPLSLLPHAVQVVGKIFPVTYLSDGLRQAYLYPFNLEVIGKDVLVLAAWFLTLLVVTISVFRLRE